MSESSKISVQLLRLLLMMRYVRLREVTFSLSQQRHAIAFPVKLSKLPITSKF
ncbi:MAG: hypothetical protein WBB28_28595 [Crinalium sp.]